jgi:hypothetical protein
VARAGKPYERPSPITERTAMLAATIVIPGIVVLILVIALVIYLVRRA